VPGTSFQFMYISIYYIYMPMPMPMPMPSGKHTHAWCGDKSKITAYFLGGATHSTRCFLGHLSSGYCFLFGRGVFFFG